MKIISKFKCFYDFNNIYDTDESLVYYRNPTYFSNNMNRYNSYHFPFKLLNNTVNPIITEEALKNIELPIKENILVAENPKDRREIAEIDYTTIGIFPKVYIIPTLIVGDLDSYTTRNEIANKKTILNFPNNEIKTIKDLEKFLKNNYPDLKFIYREYKKDLRSYFSGKIDLNIKEIENKDIFHKLNSPTFYISEFSNVRWSSDDWFRYINKNSPGGRLILSIDCDFSDLTVTSLKTISNDSSVYNRIEEFLIEKNTVNIPEADNKTKIINAGFDLKTSFRKEKINGDSKERGKK